MAARPSGTLLIDHECETSWLACLPIGHDFNLRDGSKFFKNALKVSFGDGG